MKTKLDDLAILGGQPSFEQKLHVGRPNIGSRYRLLHRIGKILDRRWLTNNGPCVQEFEREIAKLLAVKHCVTTCNGTAGLEIAIQALGLSGEVILPSFTFIATAHALYRQGVIPVFCDVNPTTYNLDPARVGGLINPHTTAILAVHLFGKPCYVAELSNLARLHNLVLLFDAAHAFCCSCNKQWIGGFGDAEVFSFHATKFFNTFEGGAVVTNSDRVAAKIRLVQNFGFVDYDRVECLGTNAKMSEVSAAMGLTGLESLGEFLRTNYANYKAYQQRLNGIPGMRLLEYDESEKCNYQYLVLEIDERVTPLSRDELGQVLWAENVLVRRYFYPGCHRMEPYRSLFPDVGRRLPVTERLANSVLVLPTGTSITEQDIDTICNLIRLAVLRGRELSNRLRIPLQASSPLAAQRISC